ncbi:hypothetical protein NPX13_g10655 [Xylaria arbuscula]|uniref:Uncharacterized protein n=1 Tax=Xylaria arbuscula TaxID=114810 RepID=A0A9W8TGK5_9PEZI|nr:hypothetical protein NPX13_g10655 [Xylaria arbuscula]
MKGPMARVQPTEPGVDNAALPSGTARGDSHAVKTVVQGSSQELLTLGRWSSYRATPVLGGSHDSYMSKHGNWMIQAGTRPRFLPGATAQACEGHGGMMAGNNSFREFTDILGSSEVKGQGNDRRQRASGSGREGLLGGSQTADSTPESETAMAGGQMLDLIRRL